MSKVYISPSMQEHNAGAIPGYIEENEMQAIGDEVVKLLQFNHLEVYRNNPAWTLAQAVIDSNSKKVDLHVAIHSNSGGARGCEIFHHSNSKNGVKAAMALYKYAEPLTPTKDRGLKATTALYEIKNTDAPCVLIEIDFHDSAEGAAWIDSHKKEIAEAITHGICDYFGIEFKKPEIKKLAVLPGDFNEKFYLFKNPDVSEAVAKGQFKNGADHFLNYGFNENREYKITIPADFNPVAYMVNSPDVAKAYAELHYVSYGVYENRNYK